MTSRCRIEMLAEPLEATIEDVESGPLDVFFAFGIVNPFGPTLSFVGAIGAPRTGARLPIVNVMLNPFSQTVSQVGWFVVGDVWTPLDDFEPLLQLGFGSCPTLLLLNHAVPEGSRQEVAAKILGVFEEDVTETYLAVKQFFGDPWTRVSKAMQGTVSEADQQIDAVEAADRLAELVLKPEHMFPELRALMYAWRGSIEETGISGSIKDSALGTDRFTDILTKRISPSIWLPEEPPAPEPPVKPPRPAFQPQSLADVRAMLQTDDWVAMASDDLLQLLQAAMLLYGSEVNSDDVPLISRVYHEALRRTEAEHRALMARELTKLVERHHLSPVAFLPILVVETEFNVVTTATIDFVSCSPLVDTGESYALVELRSLLRDHTLANPGAVFGALVSMGEHRFLPFLTEVRAHLTTEQVRIAAQVHTPYLQHHDMRFWLEWAKELINLSDDAAQRNFGSCASALVLARRHEKTGKVYEGERDFPCAEKETPIRILREWPIDDYAKELAPDLYVLEAQEALPKLMSSVLRAWGYEPAARLEDQFIPESTGEEESPVRLRRL